MLWSRVPKSFDRSRNILIGVLPLSKAIVVLSTSSSTACSVERCFLKPENCRLWVGCCLDQFRLLFCV